jgi:hypothetical protein
MATCGTSAEAGVPGGRRLVERATAFEYHAASEPVIVLPHQELTSLPLHLSKTRLSLI